MINNFNSEILKPINIWGYVLLGLFLPVRNASPHQTHRNTMECVLYLYLLNLEFEILSKDDVVK